MSLIQDVDLTNLTKSLKLLHSPDEDSTEQLRILVEETIKSKYGKRKSINLSGLGLNKKSSVADKMTKGKRIKLDESTKSSPLYVGAVEKGKPTTKGKRIKLDESTKSSPFYGGGVEKQENSDSGDGVAIEILDDDLSCVVCREMAVRAGNNLVECLECHSLYHQECHDPLITQDVNDPRFVWYCSNCTKNLNKVGSSKGSSSNLSQSSKPDETKKTDYITYLNNSAIRMFKEGPIYTFTNNNLQFMAKCQFGQLITNGTGRKKNIAKADAARAMIGVLGLK